MNSKKFFWLHVKKSAGMSVRNLLQPYYLEVDRTDKPKEFLQATQDEYNDILNNYRVILGDYQFKRCLFAKKYLYKEEWDNILSFAFSREPVDRCVSMFFWLYWEDRGFVLNFRRSLNRALREKKFFYNTSYAFDAFLDLCGEAVASDSIYGLCGNHFTTHTAAMWDDITDKEGNVLLKRVFKLENLIEGLNQVFEECGLEKRIEKNAQQRNKNPHRNSYKPSIHQIQRIQSIYYKDFDIYEKAL